MFTVVSSDFEINYNIYPTYLQNDSMKPVEQLHSLPKESQWVHYTDGTRAFSTTSSSQRLWFLK